MIRRGIAVLALLSVGVSLAACQKKPRVSTPEPDVTVVLPPEPEPNAVVNFPAPTPPTPPPPTPPPEPRAAPPPPPTLVDADSYFAVARYAAASLSYSMYLTDNPDAKDRDRALFRLAVSQALSPSPTRGLRPAEATLEELVAQFPDSFYAVEGKLLLSLIRENRRLRGDAASKDETIKSLQEDLDRLKKIDMNRRIPPFR